MSRILGIDYGTKKIGFAISDEEQKIAFPKDVHANIWQFVYDLIRKSILEDNVSEIVIGLPLNLDKTENKLTEEVSDFVDKLKEHFRLPIHFEDESFTSKAVHKQHVAPYHKADASAAALILQSFLDRRNIKSRGKGT